MDRTSAENHIFEQLTASRESSALHLRALAIAPPERLEEIAALGFDTNVLKALRRNTNLAERLFVNLQSSGVALITPGQSVVEYWNNHKVFASEEWNAYRSDLGNLKRRAQNSAVSSQSSGRIEEIEKLVDELAADLQEETSPEYLQRSYSLIESLLEASVMPLVSRLRFMEVAVARFGSKFPPGFADGPNKASPYGDFFVWCDFLLGALQVEHAERHAYVWVTNEKKPDWKAGTVGHPSLTEEFLLVKDAELSILDLDALVTLLDANTAAPLPQEARTATGAD